MVLQEEAHPKEVPPEEAHQEEALQGEAPQAEHQEEEEEPRAEDLPEEDNHLRNKPKWHNQDPNKLDHDMNLYMEQKSKNSEETEPMPRNS